MDQAPDFRIFVFSYNRPRFLRHCLHSIDSCAQHVRATVIDDNSSDPECKRLMSDFGDRYDFVVSTQCEMVEYKCGGLYGSMNLAMQIAHSENVEYAIFLQDDMQFTRNLTASDFARLRLFFQKNPNAIQCQTCFRRRNSAQRLSRVAQLDPSETAFFLPDDAEEGKDNFSDVGVFSIRRVKERLGSFSIGEDANSLLCRQLAIKMGLATFPFMNWLPYPASFRGNRRNIAHRVIERLGGAGFHPIELMSQKDEERLLNKDPSVIPVAEDWLSAPSAPRHDYWSTGGGEYNLLARGGIPAAAFRAARWSKRKLFGLRV